MYEVGSMPPSGYIAWDEWASAQIKGGLKQSQCGCELWLFPQEVKSHKCSPTKRAPDSPSGYSVKPSMPKGYKFAIVNCPKCKRPVKQNWLVKHINSGCKIPVTNNSASG